MPRKRIDDVMVAYHEAGHAVMALSFHRAVLRISIVPKDGMLGYITLPGRETFSHPYSFGTFHPVREARDALIYLAGPAATRRYRGRDELMDLLSSLVDWKEAWNSLSQVKNTRVANLLVKRTCWKLYQAALAHTAMPRYWSVVEQLAQRLQKERILSGPALWMFFLEAAERAFATHPPGKPRRVTPFVTLDDVAARTNGGAKSRSGAKKGKGLPLA
jgi:hypothetical protein